MSAAAANLAAPASSADTTARKKSDSLGVLLQAIPFLGILMFWLWVSDSILLVASRNLNTTLVLVVIGTAILVAVDASQLGFGQQKRETGPAGWFLGTLLLYVIVYPLYMFARTKKGGGRYGAGALVVMIVFLVYGGMVAVRINDAVMGIQQVLRGM